MPASPFTSWELSQRRLLSRATEDRRHQQLQLCHHRLQLQRHAYRLPSRPLLRPPRPHQRRPRPHQLLLRARRTTTPCPASTWDQRARPRRCGARPPSRPTPIAPGLTSGNQCCTRRRSRHRLAPVSRHGGGGRQINSPFSQVYMHQKEGRPNHIT